MLLKSLKLNNIRSYLTEEINFPQGAVLLSGDIGSGKSTILLAIEFALFGILRSELSGNSLLRNGKNFGEVELGLSLGGREVIIKRTLKRAKEGVKQESGQIIVDGASSDMTPQELKARILELLGYPEDLLTSAKSLVFRYTVYTPQEEMKKIIFDDEKERLNTLRRVFGIDRYKRIIENSDIVAKRISDDARIFSEKISDLGDKIRQREELETQKKSFREIFERISAEIGKNVPVLEEKRKKVSECEKSISKYNELKNEFNVMRAKLSEKEAQEKRLLSEIEKLKNELISDEEKIRQAPEIYTENFEQFFEEEQKKYLLKISERASLAEKKSEVEKRIKEMREELDAFEKAGREIKERRIKSANLKEAVSQKEMLDGKIESLRKSMDELKELISTKEALKKSAHELMAGIMHADSCPVCSQPLFLGQKKNIEREQEARIGNFNGEIAELLLKKNGLGRQIEDFTKKLNDVLSAEKELERVEGMLSNSGLVEKNFEQKRELFSELSSRLDEFSKKLSALSVAELENAVSMKKEVMARVKEAEFAKRNIPLKKERLAETEKTINQLKEDKSRILTAEMELTKMISAIGNYENALAEARKELESFQESMKKIEMQKLSAEKDIENSEKIIRMLSVEIKEKTEVKSRMEKLREKHVWLKERLVPLVKLIESHIMQAVYQEFDSHFRNWASLLIEDESINLRLDENFAPVAEQNGFLLDVSDLSGGEKTSCALAYRLALNKVINDIMSTIKTKNILILDEPTDGFSSEQLDKVRDVLEQINLQQTIIVSHEAKLESFVDNIIRITKSHHVSRVLA